MSLWPSLAARCSGVHCFCKIQIYKYVNVVTKTLSIQSLSVIMNILNLYLGHIQYFNCSYIHLCNESTLTSASSSALSAEANFCLMSAFYC